DGAEGEYSAVVGRQPVSAAARRGGDADDPRRRSGAGQRPEELRRAVAGDGAVVRGQPVAGAAFRPGPGDGDRRAGEPRRAVGALGGRRTVGGDAVDPGGPGGGGGGPQVHGTGRHETAEQQRSQGDHGGDDVTERDATPE